MYEIDLRVVDGDAELSDYTISDSQLQGNGILQLTVTVFAYIALYTS